MLVAHSLATSETIRNLGIIFDCHMSMSHHISHICSTVTFYLRNIARIRRFIDQSACHNAVRSLVLSHIDYCNGFSIPFIRLNWIMCNNYKILVALKDRYKSRVRKIVPRLCLLGMYQGQAQAEIISQTPLHISETKRNHHKPTWMHILKCIKLLCTKVSYKILLKLFEKKERI